MSVLAGSGNDNPAEVNNISSAILLINAAGVPPDRFSRSVGNLERQIETWGMWEKDRIERRKRRMLQYFEWCTAVSEL